MNTGYKTILNNIDPIDVKKIIIELDNITAICPKDESLYFNQLQMELLSYEFAPKQIINHIIEYRLLFEAILKTLYKYNHKEGIKILIDLLEYNMEYLKNVRTLRMT